MKTALRILFLMSIGTHGFCFGQSALNLPLVVVDPGHGGTDSGAIGTHGVSEKNVVLDVAQEMIRLNQEIYGGVLELYLTRYSDTLISLTDRTRLARALKVDAYVSIHCNQAKRTGAQGIEVFIPEGSGRFMEASLQLTNAIAQDLGQDLGLKDRGVKVANFQVLRETAQLCPSVLVELGFLSNRVEEEHFKKGSSITAMALVILETLKAYFDERNHE